MTLGPHPSPSVRGAEGRRSSWRPSVSGRPRDRSAAGGVLAQLCVRASQQQINARGAFELTSASRSYIGSAGRRRAIGSSLPALQHSWRLWTSQEQLYSLTRRSALWWGLATHSSPMGDGRWKQKPSAWKPKNIETAGRGGTRASVALRWPAPVVRRAGDQIV
jgi:hypothetical protein